MSKPKHSRMGRACPLGLSLALLTGGCFQDHVMSPAGIESSTDDGASTGGMVSGGTGLEGTSTGVDDGSSGGPADDGASTGFEGSTGGDSSDGGETDGSTGEQLDGTTGQAVLSVDELLPGDLVITEVMSNPNCSLDSCEWIELLNATELPVNLVDLYVQDIDHDAGNQGRVTLDVIVPPGEVAVIARGVEFWPYDFEPAAVYGPNPGLNNGSPDRVVVRSISEIIDETMSLSIEHPEGVAWSLSADHLDASSNDSADHWCDATAPLATVSSTEYGTPGALNPPC